MRVFTFSNLLPEFPCKSFIMKAILKIKQPHVLYLILSLVRQCVIRPITEELSEPDNLYETKPCILCFILIRNNLLSVITLPCL